MVRYYGKQFAFTVFDDTDDATVSNIKPVYDLLQELGIMTTKSVWVYPSRGPFLGSSLQDPDYRAFVLELKEKGFEIGLHSVGDGPYRRDEIIRGLNEFRDIFGAFPTIHTNHSGNIDGLYWYSERFEWPMRTAYKLCRGGGAEGEITSSPFYWGDLAKKHLRYIRNLTFNSTNTLSCDPRMPYQVSRTAKCANLWFSSSDGQTVAEFTDLIAPERIDRLAEEGGACVVYTHFASGFVDKNGKISPKFERNLRNLASKKGWFAPVTTVLDHLRDFNGREDDPGYIYRFGTNFRWGIHRLAKWQRYGR